MAAADDLMLMRAQYMQACQNLQDSENSLAEIVACEKQALHENNTQAAAEIAQIATSVARQIAKLRGLIEKVRAELQESGLVLAQN